jgi:indole-3-glycerol phosphate synthase
LPNFLEKILEQKRKDVATAMAQRPLAELQRAAAHAPSPRDFVGTLKARHPMGLIAEIKKASPSAGLIRPDFDPVQIARSYAQNGAACISVLTDKPFFEGSLDDLQRVRTSVEIPVLRKDFIIAPYQVWEARASGADCILLIAECLDDASLSSLYVLTSQLGMQALAEIYDAENLGRVLALNPPFIGINNRNLRTFDTDLEHTIRLRRQIPKEILVVGESGISTREDVLALQNAGVHAMLVGESLMRSANIGQSVRELLGTTD